MSNRRLGITALIASVVACMGMTTPGFAQQTQSRLFEVTKNKKLRVCQFPLYYSISFRNPKTGQIEGIDADLAKELAKELDAQLEMQMVHTAKAELVATQASLEPGKLLANANGEPCRRQVIVNRAVGHHLEIGSAVFGNRRRTRRIGELHEPTAHEGQVHHR